MNTPKYPHYLHSLQDATRKDWNKPALNTIGGDSFTYAQMATDIARFHIVFEKAGFRKGDIILKMQGEDVYYVSEFNTILRRNDAGTEIAVTYLRGGEEYEATFRVGMSE